MHSVRPYLACLMVLPLAWGAAGAADSGGPSGARPRVVAAGSGEEHGGHEHEGLAQGAPKPGTPAASWAELRAVRDAIAADVEGGRLGEIHAESERLAPLANSLLESSKDLAPEKRARVESAVEQLPKLAGALHEAADAGNAEATRRELKRLDGLLELIRAQYPPDVLSSAAPAASGHDHAMHDHGHAPGTGAVTGHAHGAGAASGHAHAEGPLAAV